MSIIDDYFNARKQIVKIFKHPYLPLEDHRDCRWMIVDEKLVYQNFAFDEKDFDHDGGQFYDSTIYENDPLVDYIYYIGNYTIITVDLHMSAGGSLIVLSNDLECKDEKLKNLYRENWK